ncbi:MAG: hypothetical protein COA91_11565 [Robiginitomaculum sp.]|nr:MAG: hypothetical protein COA91_11565 [Robiginitomaculum sp.]
MRNLKNAFSFLPSSVSYGGSGRLLHKRHSQEVALDGGQSLVLRITEIVPPIPPSKNEGYHSRHRAFALLWLKPRKRRRKEV